MASSPSSSSSSVHSAPQSHPDQGLEHPEPELETLISHLVAAKRSLSSIHHVWRANEIVTAARSALEESVVAYSRTGFLRHGLNNQLRLLYSVRNEVEEVSRRGRAEFSGVLKDLDAADARLRKTLNLLRETIVHAGFRPEGEEPKSLHDFVDERAVEDLNASLKVSIDRTNAAQAELDVSNSAFDDQLRSIKQALGHYRAATMPATASPTSSSSSAASASNSSLPPLSSMPSMLSSLEMHAQEVANLLESLVRHFDLCVTAVKHTEGGGAAARSITGDMPPGVNVNNPGGPNLEDANAPLEPLSHSEYQEMKNVIIKDAAEAEDVVLEIQDRIGEMESILENVLTQRDSLLSVYHATVDIFQHLSSLASTGLPGCIAQAYNFSRIWNEEHDRINVGLADLSDLHSLYEGFLDAYDGLILEVARRKHVRQRVEKILRETRQKLDQLYEEDVNAREAFRVEQGDYLPSDIWPGVSGEPMRVEFLRTSGNFAAAPTTHAGDGGTAAVDTKQQPRGRIAVENTDGGEVIPDLPRHVIEQSLARLNARTKR